MKHKGWKIGFGISWIPALFIYGNFATASYDRFKIWLKEVTGNENFGLRPKINLSSGQPLGDQLVEAFLHKVSELEGRLSEKEQRISFLEWQLAQGKAKDMNEAIAVLEACKD